MQSLSVIHVFATVRVVAPPLPRLIVQIPRNHTSSSLDQKKNGKQIGVAPIPRVIQIGRRGLCFLQQRRVKRNKETRCVPFPPASHNQSYRALSFYGADFHMHLECPSLFLKFGSELGSGDPPKMSFLLREESCLYDIANDLGGFSIRR